MPDASVIWPCIIKHANDPELSYVSSQHELQSTDFEASDKLIDASGAIYQPGIIATGEILTLTDILGLVKAHAAQSGSCCVAKLYAPSITEAFKIVEATSDI